MSNFSIKENDTLPAIRAILKDSSGAVVNLTNATVRFHMRNTSNSNIKVDSAATVVDAAGGVVDYEWTSADTDVAGQYEIEFEVTFSGGGIQTFPNDSYGTVVVYDDLA